MAHRLRHAMKDDRGMFAGPVEVDETYVGGRNRKCHANKRYHHGIYGKTPIVGMKDQASGSVFARPVEVADTATATKSIAGRIREGAKIFTDCSSIYERVERQSVNHSRGEYVRDEVHTNGIESFWALLKCAYMGVYYWWCAKRAHSYVDECARRYNLRGRGTLERSRAVFDGMQGWRLTWEELVS